MSEIKSCPSCNRSYSDLSLSFCLEDGSLLSASHELTEFKNEVETLVRSSGEKSLDPDFVKRYSEFVTNRDKIAEKFNKTERTKEEHPILNSQPEFKKKLKDWKASEYTRKITFEITGLHTYHAQENLVILKEYINEFIIDKGNKIIDETTMSLGVGNFYTRNRQSGFSYSFKKEDNPTKESFLKKLNDFLSSRT